MTESKELPIDLDLWMRSRSAPADEKWKWFWGTWDPVITLIWEGDQRARSTATGRFDFEDLICPVCGEKQLYAFFLAVYVAIQSTKKRNQTVYIGDRWFGCDNCQTQVRDRGELPYWIKNGDLVWAKEEFKRRAERSLREL
jgi:hypothetical protein